MRDDHDDRGDLFTGWQNGEPLPYAETALIDEEKFVSYAMNPSHPRQVEANKWRVYAEVGYEVVVIDQRILSARNVIGQIRDKLKTTGAFLLLTALYGPRLEVTLPIVGPNGKSLRLRTIWQYDKGSMYPRLITAIGEMME